MTHVVLADIHMFYDWDWAASERELKQTATVAPHNVDVLSEEAWLSETLGRRDDALKQIQAALAQDPMNPGALQILATTQESRGHLPEAEAALAGMLQMDAELNAFGIAEVYGFRDQTDEAMHWLERAYAQKDAYLYTINRDPLLKNLESDSGYKALLRKMNLPEQRDHPN